MEQVRADMVAADDALDARISTNESGIATLETRLDRVEGELQRLAEEFDATVQRLETALRFAAPVHFAFDDATVRPEDREVLERFSSVIQDYYPDALITVEGFTDPSGSADYNRRLGQLRADAVKTVLVDEGGLTGERVRTVSYGEDTSRLVAAGAQGPGNTGMENRRVVLVIDHSNATVDRPVVTATSGEGN
jgi:peptidoglycan-associated lipoprotein